MAAEKPTDDPLARLLASSAAGDRRAFARLYELTAGKLFALCIAILRRRDLAEDALQEGYARIWRAAHRYEPDQGPAMAWIVAIVRNRALSLREQQLRRPAEAGTESLELIPDEGPDPVEQAMQSSALRALMLCLAELEEKQRQSILLAYYHGLTHGELAARLATPLGTVKSWIRRGLIDLRRCLGDETA